MSNNRNFNDYRTPGEWYFYTVSNTNQPPFLAGGTGVYLKVIMGYSTTNCIQLCWRRESSEMWTRHSTSATAWSAWTRFVASAEVDSLQSRLDVLEQRMSPGAVWTNRTSETLLWYSICYGNGMFVAVALTGTNRVMTSPGLNF